MYNNIIMKSLTFIAKKKKARKTKKAHVTTWVGGHKKLETANDIKVPDIGDHLIDGELNTAEYLSENIKNIAISYNKNRAVLLTN
jgi:hypothetical protein